MQLVTIAGWTIDDQIQSLGTITVDTTKTLWWNVYPTTTGYFNATVFANSSTAANDTVISSRFISYKNRTESITPQETLPILLNASDSLTFSWDCDTGEYRAADLNLNYTNVTSEPKTVILRVTSYNGTSWNDILHSYTINLTSDNTYKIPVLKRQLDTNETGYCVFNITNIGLNAINITSLDLQAYYNETVSVQDIQASIGTTNITGL